MSIKLLERLEKNKLIQPPSWLIENTVYLTYMGSIVYGCNTDMSDVDMYGVCVPPKEIVFPEQYGGEIYGFGRQIQRFEQFQQHHIKDPSNKNEYDFSVYNIVKYFTLLMENNPNITDSINVRDNHIVHIDNVGKHIRDNRNIFLHKGSMHKFRGYAHSTLSKMLKNPAESRKKYYEGIGYDSKQGYHTIRLLLQAEQIAKEQTLDLQKNKNILMEIRNGSWSYDQLKKYAEDKMVELEEIYKISCLPEYPDEKAIKKLLVECLEMKYGNLSIL